jgi:small subunit ribosomal protein S17
MAHDPENTCNIGDTVRIIESAPLSARKCWALETVMTRAEQL